MSKVLIATVGTGTRADTNILRPLIETVRNSHPDLVVFLVSRESEPNALKVRERLGLVEGSWELVHLEDQDDVNKVFRQTMDLLRVLVARGFSPEEIEVDYTTGTKSMSAGAVLAGVAGGCAALKYVGGDRDQGVVMDETERVITARPSAILAYQEMERARGLFRELRFGAALAACGRIKPVLLGKAAAEDVEELQSLIQGYDRWDKFRHLEAVGELAKVDFEKPWNAPFRVAKEVRTVRLVGIGKAIAKEEMEITEDLLADLANNAVRRWYEGKYDDAVARFYRLVEMVGQRALWEEAGIRAGDVDVAKVPQSWRERLEAHRHPKDGKVKIGLEQVYRLLAELRLPLGLDFQRNDKLSGLLKVRNDSILAHGTKPVSEAACLSLGAEAVALAERAVPGFAARREELQFPWLRDKMVPRSGQ